jgi:DNA-directed RNA polymerase subunit RPC12/RpoP
VESEPIVHLMVEVPRTPDDPKRKYWMPEPERKRSLLCGETDPTALCAEYSDEVTCPACLARIAPGKGPGLSRKERCLECGRKYMRAFGSRETRCPKCRPNIAPSGRDERMFSKCHYKTHDDYDETGGGGRLDE